MIQFYFKLKSQTPPFQFSLCDLICTVFALFCAEFYCVLYVFILFMVSLGILKSAFEYNKL